MTDLDARTAAKRAAGEAAVERFVHDGMRVGLGTGSTAVWALRRIGALLAAGDLGDIAGVPTSSASESEARACGIPLTTLDAHPFLDVTIDGADEVSPTLDLVKGGGGAHLREKIVAQASGRLVIVVDETKLVPAAGHRLRGAGRGGADGAAARARVPRTAGGAGDVARRRGRHAIRHRRGQPHPRRRLRPAARPGRAAGGVAHPRGRGGGRAVPGHGVVVVVAGDVVAGTGPGAAVRMLERVSPES